MTNWWVAPILLSVALSGCGAVGAIGLHPFSKKDSQVAADVNPAPTPPVVSNDLPPADANASAGSQASAMNDSAIAAPPAAGVAAIEPGGDVSRTDLLGGWTLSNGTESCQLFMTLTSWTGGYRASTRGCNSDALKAISAWNIDGKQVVLAGAAGAPIAELGVAAQSRFEGRLVGSGGTIVFYR
jgi:hypothetical protein